MLGVGKVHMTQAGISAISPLFIVSHVPSSLSFYRDRLGFEITFEGPGVVVAQGLSYCNRCGAKLNDVKGESIVKSREVRPESLVWAMVAVLFFGFVGIVFLMMAMKTVGLDVGQIIAFTILSFLIMLFVEGVFIWKFLRSKRGTEETTDTALSKEQAPKEFDSAQSRVLPEPLPSVTEHTTRTFEPSYSERKSE